MKYKLLPFMGKFHCSACAELSKWQSILVAMRVPHTLGEWIMASKSAHVMMCATPAYGTLWLVRSYMIAEMRARAISHLHVKPRDKAADLKIAFPDQCSWLKRVAAPTTKLTTVIKAAGYTGPIEMLTCDMCIFGGGQSLKWSTECIRANASKIRRVSKDLGESRERQAHPLIALRIAMQT